jgi:hypothetical protein
MFQKGEANIYIKCRTMPKTDPEVGAKPKNQTNE